MTTLHHAPFFTLASSLKWDEASELEAQLSQKQLLPLAPFTVWVFPTQGKSRARPEGVLTEAVLAQQA